MAEVRRGKKRGSRGWTHGETQKGKGQIGGEKEGRQRRKRRNTVERRREKTEEEGTKRKQEKERGR